MCPIYVYKDKKTGKVVEVTRSFSNWEKPPEKEDGIEITGEEEWERQLQSFLLQHPPGYGKKGDWG